MSYYVDGAVVPEFALALRALGSAFGVDVGEERARVYAKALGDIPYDDVRRALSACVKHGRRFPTVAEIRERVQPSEDDAALLAWNALDQAAAECGAWMSVAVEDVAAAEALMDVFGSWAVFCDTDDGPGLALKRQQFMAAYRNRARSSHTYRRSQWLVLRGRFVSEHPCLTVGVVRSQQVSVVRAEQLPQLVGRAIAIGSLTDGQATANEAGAAPEGEGQGEAVREQGHSEGQK